MDKRDLCLLLAERVKTLVGRHPGGMSGLSRDSGVDRSAIAALVSPGNTRLPRAEALRRLAESAGVSADWLLGLSFSEERERDLTPSMEIEAALTEDGETPIARWHREAAGHKIRYVPAQLPDHLVLPALWTLQDPSGMRRHQAEASMATIELGETDLEIAMPCQRLECLVTGTGLFADVDPRVRRAQLAHMADLVSQHYPALRLHLYDARQSFATPFTVFGPMRAALYLGSGYLVLSAAEDVRRLARLFDGLVREAVVGADRAADWLSDRAWKLV